MKHLNKKDKNKEKCVFYICKICIKFSRRAQMAPKTPDLA